MHTGRTYAMKTVVKTCKEDERFFQQAINEYEIAQAINHPNIRKIYSLRRIRKLFAIRELRLLMEYCPGRSVQEVRPASILDACSIFAQVANALAKMNEYGYVHADMKPNNIIVDEEGNVRMIDFGQSCRMGTVKQRIQGTPDYMAPEQVKRQPLDARTDVYNFGASFYWTLTGKPLPSILPRHVRQPAGPDFGKPARELNPEVPPMLDELVCDCTHLDPDERPQTMEEVVDRMSVILQKELASAD